MADEDAGLTLLERIAIAVEHIAALLEEAAGGEG